MTLFWFLSLLMVLTALGAVLWPLLREQPAEASTEAVDSTELNVRVFRARRAELLADHEAGQIAAEALEVALAELERELLRDTETRAAPGKLMLALGDRWVVAGLLLLLPLSVLLGYPQVGGGDWTGLRAPAIDQRQASSGEDDFLASIASLERRLAGGEGDGEGWLLLARSRLVMGEYGAALAAYEEAHRQLGDQPELLVDYAEAIVLADGAEVPPRARLMIRQVLDLQPDNTKALWIAGIAARQAGDFAAARQHWGRLLELLPPDDRLAQELPLYLEEMPQ